MSHDVTDSSVRFLAILIQTELSYLTQQEIIHVCVTYLGQEQVGSTV